MCCCTKSHGHTKLDMGIETRMHAVSSPGFLEGVRLFNFTHAIPLMIMHLHVHVQCTCIYMYIHVLAYTCTILICGV